MATDAQGRQLSEDGFYYWDGSAWQAVQQDGGSGSSGSSGGGGGGQGGGDFGQAFAQSMSQAGYAIDASAVPDASAVQSGVSSAMQWYQSLDPTTQQAIDAATAGAGQAAIALSEAGVATGIDPLLHAFDQLDGSLGQLLNAAQQALSTAQQGASA